MNLYVIGYDITNNKRLLRMHRYLASFAIPVQRSIFLLWGSEDFKNQCLLSAKKLLNEKQDSFCCCRLPTNGKQILLGLKPLPEGVFFAPIHFSLN